MTTAGPDQPAVPLGRPAPSLRGVSPRGDPVEIAMEGASALLIFITTDCRECRDLWESMRHSSPPEGLVVVTPSPSTESRRRLAGLLPPGVVAVMSSDAWFDYGVAKAPSCRLVAGGVVVAGGPAPATWEDLVSAFDPGAGGGRGAGG